MKLCSLLLFSSAVLADLVYQQWDDSCSKKSTYGNEQFCSCNGACTGSGSKDQCLKDYQSIDYCSKTDTPPSCPGDLVAASIEITKFEAIGSCGADPDCKWVVKKWEWECCGCPSGYKPTTSLCPLSNQATCVGCGGAGEILTKDENGEWQCSGNKGVTCDIVDNLAKQLEITSKANPDTNGYYRQVLNLACLRSDCPNPACDGVREYASDDDECQNLSGTFAFEQNVFQTFAQTPNAPDLQGTVAGIAAVTTYIQNEIDFIPVRVGGSVDGIGSYPLSGASMILSALIAFGRTYGPIDSKTIASSLAGGLHFQNDLAKGFNQYIKKLIGSASSLDDIREKAADLEAEHNRLFKCAVLPGFTYEGVIGEFPPISIEIAKLIVPPGATAVRENAVDSATDNWIEAHPDPNEKLRRRSTPASIQKTLFWAEEDRGNTLPTDPSLKANYRNWLHVTNNDYQHTYNDVMSSKMTELSGTDPATITGDLLTEFTLEIPARDADLNSFVNRATLIFPGVTSIPNAPYLSKIHGYNIYQVGPVLSVTDAATEILTINGTHALGANFYDPPVLIKDAQAAQAVASIPPASDSNVMYRKATLSLAYSNAYTTTSGNLNPATGITIYDLLSGKPLPAVTYTGTASAGTFKANLSLGKGIWGGSWHGGGLFGLGLVNTTAVPVSSSSSGSIQTSSKTAPLSSTRAASSTKFSITSSSSKASSSASARVTSSQSPHASLSSATVSKTFSITASSTKASSTSSAISTRSSSIVKSTSSSPSSPSSSPSPSKTSTISLRSSSTPKSSISSTESSSSKSTSKPASSTSSIFKPASSSTNLNISKTSSSSLLPSVSSKPLSSSASKTSSILSVTSSASSASKSASSTLSSSGRSTFSTMSTLVRSSSSSSSLRTSSSMTR